MIYFPVWSAFTCNCAQVSSLNNKLFFCTGRIWYSSESQIFFLRQLTKSFISTFVDWVNIHSYLALSLRGIKWKKCINPWTSRLNNIAFDFISPKPWNQVGIIFLCRNWLINLLLHTRIIHAHKLKCIKV